MTAAIAYGRLGGLCELRPGIAVGIDGAPQLVYEVGEPLYLNPDVSTRLDTFRLEQAGPDRVRISGATGQSYGIGAVDLGSALRVAVTAGNSTGAHTWLPIRWMVLK